MPVDINGLYAQYTSLQGAKDPKSQRLRRDLASQIQAARRTAKTDPMSINTGPTRAPSLPPPQPTDIGANPAGASSTASSQDPADQMPMYSDADLGIGVGSAADGPPQLIPPEVWQQVLQGLSSNSQWASNVQMPTQQQLAEIYAKNYNQQLQDLSHGVQAKQQQAQRSREQVLADRGIPLDSQAYRNDQQSMADARASEDAGLRTQARAFAQQQADSEFNRALQSAGLEMDKARLNSDLKYKGLEALTPLVTAQAQMKENRYLAEFNAQTQERLVRLELDQADRHFLQNLSFEEKRHVELLSEQVAARVQNNDQFKKTMKLEVQKFKAAETRMRKEFLYMVQRDKTMTQIEREKLAEMVRSNKATEAIQMYAARKAGSGQSPDDAYNLIIARNQAMIDSLVQNGMSQEDAVRVVAGYGEKGPGGNSYSFSG